MSRHQSTHRHRSGNVGGKRITTLPPETSTSTSAASIVQLGVHAKNIFSMETSSPSVLIEEHVSEQNHVSRKRRGKKGGFPAQKFSQIICNQFGGNVEQYLDSQQRQVEEVEKRHGAMEREKQEQWKKMEQHVESRQKKRNLHDKDTGNFVKLNLRRKGPRKLKTRALRGKARMRRYHQQKAEEKKEKNSAEENVIVNDEKETLEEDLEWSGQEEEEEEEQSDENEPNTKKRKVQGESDTYEKSQIDHMQSEDEEFKTKNGDTTLMQLLKKHFSFDTFRPGQREAIEKVMIEKESCLLELPTGSGKTLCYQLPALMLPSHGQLVLVVSPLLSLMRDQLENLPSSLKGAMLSTYQTPKQQDDILDRVSRGDVQLLFVSPERLTTDRFMNTLHSVDFPRIALACIDEAHCISEWSHNFRPAFLHLRNSIRKLGCETILALTATATRKTAHSICKSLEIDVDGGIVRGSQTVRNNFCFSVNKSPDGEHKVRSLLYLLRSDRFKDLHSIIIYTSTRRDADTLFQILKNHEFDAERYHAGLDAKERNRIQKSFHENKLRILCSTVAFGMGINKSDIECVIHYDIPRSMEHYIQEIGRAGRDGREAQVHMFLCDDDYLRLRSMCYTDYVDQVAMKKLLSMIFQPGTPHLDVLPSIFDIALPMDHIEHTTDVRHSVISTVLSMLELHGQSFIRQHSKGPMTYTVEFSTGVSVAQQCKTNPCIAAIVKACSNGTADMIKTKRSRFTFDVSIVARIMDVTMDTIETTLSSWKDEGKITHIARSNEAYRIRVLQTPKNITRLANEIVQKMKKLESVAIKKLDTMYMVASNFAANKKQMLSREQSQFHKIMTKYFEDTEFPRPHDGNGLVRQANELGKVEHKRLVSDIRSLLRGQEGLFGTPKACARCLYGISPLSPSSRSDNKTTNVGSSMWYTLPQWASYRNICFYDLVKLVTLEVLAEKTGA